MQWSALAFSIRMLHIDGLLDEAHERNDECVHLGVALGEPDAVMWWGALNIAEGRLRGEAGVTFEEVSDYAEHFAGLPTWRLGQVQSLAFDGQVDEARRRLAELEETPEGMLDEPLPMWGPCQFAEIAHTLRDGDLAARCARALAPFRGQWSNFVLSVSAPVESHIGICKMLMGEHDEAIALLEEALSLIESRAPGLIPIGCMNLAEALIARAGPDDVSRAGDVLVRARGAALGLGAAGYVEAAEAMAVQIGARIS